MNTKEMAAMLLHQRLVHGVILDSCGPDEVEWEAMTGVVNALPPKWRQVIESISCDLTPSYSVVLGHCQLWEAKLVGQALRQLFAEFRPWCGGVTLTGPDLPDELGFGLHWNGNGDWVAA
jgi:hypothetical protein